MYGLWGCLLKAKALAPINARRVLEVGGYLNSKHVTKKRRAMGTRMEVTIHLNSLTPHDHNTTQYSW